MDCRWVGIAGSAAAAISAAGQLGPPPKVDPATYLSSSRKVSLHIDPSDDIGAGPCTVTLRRAGRVAWVKRLPYTLRGAAVDDAGRSAGWGYDGDVRFGIHATALHLLFLAGDGRVFKEEITPRHRSGLDLPPAPVVSDFFADSFAHRVYTTLFDFGSNRDWREYDLGTGHLAFSRSVRWTEPAARIWGAIPIAGTNLFAGVYFGVKDGDPFSIGLFDPEAHLQAALQPTGQEEPLTPSWQNPPQLSRGHRPMEFVYRSGDGKTTTNVGVERKAGGMYMLRAGPPTVVSDPRAPAVGKTVTLTLAGKVTLGTPISPSEIRDVVDIAAVDERHFAALREDAAGPSILVLDYQGKLTRPPIILPREERGLKLSQLDGQRVLLTSDPTLPGGSTEAWSVDVVSGIAGPYPIPRNVKDFSLPFDRPRIVGAGDGGLLVSGRVAEPTNTITEVRRYDRAGTLLWKHDFADVMVSDLVPFGGGAVLTDPITGGVTLLDSQGNVKRTFTYGMGFYITAVRLAPDSRFVLASMSPSGQRLGWYSADGKRLAEAKPHHETGLGIDFVRGMFIDSRGKLWGADSFGIYRFRQDGTADILLGRAPRSAEIHELSDVAVGPTGRIFARDAQTKVVHAFDVAGKWTFSATPSLASPPLDFFDRLCPTADGGVLSERGYPTSKIERLGPPASPGASPGRLTWTSRGLVDSAGRLRVAVSRDANDRWFRGIGDSAATAPNREGVILDTNSEYGATVSRVTIFAADGRAIRTFEVPRSDEVAYDGNVVIVNPGNRLAAFGRDGRPLWNADLGSRGTPFLYGGLLYVWTGGTELSRYRLPK